MELTENRRTIVATLITMVFATIGLLIVVRPTQDAPLTGYCVLAFHSTMTESRIFPSWAKE